MERVKRVERVKSVRTQGVRTSKGLGLKALALGLLALLLASAPAAQLVHLAKAQGVGAGAGGAGGASATGAEVRGALYVYKDLSASLELHVTQKLEEPVVESWSLSALLNVEPADATKTANTANLTISALAKRPILHPGELETGSYGGINYYKMSCERVLEGEVGNITTVVFRVRMYNETDEASLFILLADKRAIGPACLWEGTIAYTFSRAFAMAWKDFLEQVNLANETFAKYFVESHFYSFVTSWGGAIIDVDVLNASKTEDQIKVDFRIFIDKEKFVRNLMTWFGRGLGVHGLPERELSTNESIAFFDELFSRPRAGPISFTLTGFHNATLYDLKCSVRASREDLSRALMLTSVFAEMWWRYAHATRFVMPEPWSLLGVFTVALQGIEVRSGGELRVSLEEAKGVVPTTTIFKLDLKTPRIVKKGATTPADTLKALLNKTIVLFGFSPLIEWPLALGNAPLSVFPEEGVKVRLNGTEVKEVAFKDLGSLKVTLVTALTLFVEPSTIEVGKEVVVRGRIEPAMSVPITISVVAPDGSLKTIDVTAGGDGSFSAPIRLEKAGSYTITASYAGGELYEPSTASAVVEVKAPPAPPLSPSAVPEALWYVVAVAVVVVGIVIAVLKAPRGVRRP
jgi:hypothetical protein